MKVIQVGVLIIASNVIFHPVGQGLFTSGRIYGNTLNYDFHWVFDCGSHSKGHPRPEVKAFAKTRNLNPIDMFCISHFDEDHVNGARRLLRTCGARIIVLPYLSLHQRMTLAVTQNASGAFFSFLVDPASYVLSLAAPGARVFFIQGGGSSVDGRSVVVAGGPTDEEGDNRDAPNLPDSSRIPEDYGLLENPGRAAQIFVFLDSTQFRIDDLDSEQFLLNDIEQYDPKWEFCFYNWDQPKKVPSSIQQDLTDILNINRVSAHKFRKKTLKEIREYYAKHFGTGYPAVLEGESANRISLAMYSGPIGLGCVKSYPPFLTKPALLMTGDIYFRNQKRLLAAKKHFSKFRWDQIGVLQAPHHGADANWFAGGSSHLFHDVSVFSYGVPNGNGHPGLNTLNDLAGNHPIHVTQSVGWSCMSLFL